MTVCKIFFSFYVFINISIIKNSHVLAGIIFIFLRKRPRPNLKGFQYQI